VCPVSNENKSQRGKVLSFGTGDHFYLLVSINFGLVIKYSTSTGNINQFPCQITSKDNTKY